MSTTYYIDVSAVLTCDGCRTLSPEAEATTRRAALRRLRAWAKDQRWTRRRSLGGMVDLCEQCARTWRGPGEE